MRLSLPVGSGPRSVTVRSDAWSWNTIVDDATPSIDVPVPDNIDLRDVEAFFASVGSNGDLDPTRKIVVLKTKTRSRKR